MLTYQHLQGEVRPTFYRYVIYARVSAKLPLSDCFIANYPAGFILCQKRFKRYLFFSSLEPKKNHETAVTKL